MFRISILIFYLFLFLTFIFVATLTASNTVNSEYIPLDYGYNRKTINCIFQDSKGYMWFGTSDGLKKYDGYTFTHYRHNKKDKRTISNNFILSIHEDHNCNVWIGTKVGLNKLDTHTGEITRYYIKSAAASGKKANYFNALFADSAGILWVGTKRGLFSLQIESGRFNAHPIYSADSLTVHKEWIYSICKDKHSNFWLGTIGSGLYSFHSETKQFRRHLLITASRNRPIKNIYALCPTSSNNLLLATKQGLYKLNLDTEALTFPQPFYTEKIQTTTMSMAFDLDSTLWVSVLGSGLYKIDYKERKAVLYNKLSDKANALKIHNISTIFRDRSDVIWIGTYNNGLYKLSRQNRGKKHFFYVTKNSGQSNSLMSNTISCVAEDTLGVLWIGTTSGLVSYQIKSNMFNKPCFSSTALSGNKIYSLCLDKKRTLWIGTNKGLNSLSLNNGNIKQCNNDPHKDISFSRNIIYALLEDSFGVLWVGTTAGLYSYHKKKDIFIEHSLNSFKEPEQTYKQIRKLLNSQKPFISISGRKRTQDSCSVFNLKERTEILGISISESDDFHKLVHHCRIEETETGRIIYKQVYKDTWPQPGNPNIRIQALRHSLKAGSYRLCYQTNSSATPKNTTDSKLLGVNLFKTAYLSSENNIKIFTNNPVSLLASKQSVITLLEDKHQRLWIGTDGNGLYRFDSNRKQITSFLYNQENPNCISSNYITSLCEDKTGRIWIGTFLQGILLYNSDGNSFIRITTTNGLSSNNIKGILCGDHNHLWISTDQGLSRFNYDKNEFINYNLKNGLKTNSFEWGSYFKGDAGRLYFGTNYGLLIINTILFNRILPPKISITNFYIYDKHQTIKLVENPNLQYQTVNRREILLSHSVNIFTIEFSAHDYNLPQQNRYAYKMDGFNKDWIYIRNKREATFTNLDPGTYTFRVKGSNNDGVWNEEGASLKVIILPPWWATWWFRTLALIFILSLLYYAYNRRVSYLHKERNRQRDFSHRLIQSQEAEHKRIASDLHDSLGQNLLIVNNEIQQLTIEDEKLKEKIKPILSGVKESIEEVREISYNLHPHLLERLGLKKALESVIKKIAQASDIQFEFVLDEIDTLLAKEAQIHFYRIIQEAMNNIVKHSQADQAEIKIEKKRKYIYVFVMDNGKGFNLKQTQSENHSKTGFGLDNMQERARLIGGKFKIYSNPKKGTRIELRIPLSFYEVSSV